LELPAFKFYDRNINHAPKRKEILNRAEKKLAIKNALRYFPKKFHLVLAKEFADELATYGRIYMYSSDLIMRLKHAILMIFLTVHVQREQLC